jgi:hypothetical protein
MEWVGTEICVLDTAHVGLNLPAPLCSTPLLFGSYHLTVEAAYGGRLVICLSVDIIAAP